MTHENQYHPEDTAAATLAAFVALGAQIDGLRYEVQCQRERADEYQRTFVAACNECAELRAERDSLRKDLRKLGSELAKPARGVTWGDVQVLMVQNGIQEITRMDAYHWRAVSRDHEYEGDSVEDAAGRAARAFAAILGKAVTA